jgi:hypothetical protein
MPRKESKHAEANATRASVRKEMMLPRTARSAHVGTLKLDASRNPEPPRRSRRRHRRSRTQVFRRIHRRQPSLQSAEEDRQGRSPPQFISARLRALLFSQRLCVLPRSLSIEARAFAPRLFHNYSNTHEMDKFLPHFPLDVCIPIC